MPFPRLMLCTVLALVLAPGARSTARATQLRRTTVVHLDPSTGTVYAGADDSASDTSSVLMAQGIGRLRVPGFSGSERQWNAVHRCVADHFAAFDIEVVRERPAYGPFISVRMAGTPSRFGMDRNTSGLAPFAGHVIENAVLFVFSDSLRNRPNLVCRAVVHEIGHSLGLEHVYECGDPMSYLSGCGPQAFVDRESYCGEFAPRPCLWSETQNSYRKLAHLVGLRAYWSLE